MRRIFILSIMMLFLTSCSYSSFSGSGEKITPPQNEKSPLFGQWNVSETITIKDEQSNSSNHNILNKDIQITKDYFVLDNQALENISFKTKIVKADDYLKSTEDDNLDSVINKDSELEIFSVINQSKLICEFILIDDNSGILKMSNNTYKVSKTSSSTNIHLDNVKLISVNPFIHKNKEKSKTGILIGLKTPVNNTKDDKSFSYRTLWVSTSNNTLNPVYQVDSIIFPRKAGFWSLSQETITRNNVKEDIFIPRDLSQSEVSIEGEGKDKLVTEQSINRYTNGRIIKSLNYICNDFISVEISGEAYKDSEKEVINKLRIYPVSSLPYEKSLSTKDIFNDTSVKIINDEFLTAMESISQNNVSFMNSEEQDKNIGIVRRDSHWLFSGRLNYAVNDTFYDMDYPLSVIPPSNIVFYDNLFSPISGIKETMPTASDAFSSPNNSLSLIVSNDYLYLFNIVENEDTSMELEKDPIGKIKLKKGESIVMSEWATGGYVSSWNNFIKSNKDAKQIEE